jgi:hypothetical protein
MCVTASFELRVVGRGLSFHDCIACSDDSLSCNISRKCISYGRSVYYHEYFLLSLLIKRNRLRRRGKIAHADLLADKINHLIAEVQNSLLSKLSSSSSKEMWTAVRSCSSHVQSNGKLNSFSPDMVNQFFAKISTVNDYSRSEVYAIMKKSVQDKYRFMKLSDCCDILRIQPQVTTTFWFGCSKVVRVNSRKW